MSRLFKIAAASLALALCACQQAPLGGGRFSVEGPGKLTRALEVDQYLCDKLNVDLTVDRTDDLAPPPIDGVDLLPKPGAVCAWVLEEEYQLVAGTYDLQVDFNAKDDAADCDILAGMYVRRGLEFPFGEDVEPLTDDDFLSSSADENDPRLQEPVDFDFDDDGLDNLEELATDANPCKISSVPEVDLNVGVAEVEEGTPFDIVVSSSDEDGASHRAVVTISHHNGDLYPPETVTFVHYTHKDTDSSIDPDPGARPWDQEWNLVASLDELAESGAGRWTLSFTPEEPFVGNLTIEAWVDNGTGTLFDQATPVLVEVSEVADPPLVVLEGQSQPFVNPLEFEEQAAIPTEHRLTIMNLDLGSPASLLITGLVDGPDGLELRHDGLVTVLAWSPENLHALEPSLVATLELTDTEGITQAEVQVPLAVAPLYNDPPEIIPPAAQDLALPKIEFENHQADFVVVDVDQVDIPPVCSITDFGPAPGTSCDNALKEVSCEVIEGSRDGIYWDAVITLVPDTGFASCGSEPAFDISYRVDDTPPANATNDSEADTQTVRFRTPEILSIVPMGLSEEIEGPYGVFLDGNIKRALVTLKERTETQMSFEILGVDPTPQSENFGRLKTFTNAEADANGFPSDKMYQSGAVDEVNHRVALLGNFLPGGYGLLVVDLQNLEIAASWDLTTSCDGGNPGGTGGMSNPVVDPITGYIYYLCEVQNEARVVQVDETNTRIHRTFADFDLPFTQKDQAAVVVDQAGNSWLVLIADNGFYLVDLTTFADATPLSLLLGDSNARTITERAIDPERYSLLFTYQDGSPIFLGRILFGESAPMLDTPLQMGSGGDLSSRAITLRRPHSGNKTPPPQLVYSMGFDYYDPPDTVFVDLGAPEEAIPWSEMRRENSMDYYHNGYSNDFYPTADRRYFLQPVVAYDPTGLHLHAYQENMETVSFDADQEPDDELPHLGGVMVVATSHQANLSLMSVDLDAYGDFLILDFTEAANLLDQ